MYRIALNVSISFLRKNTRPRRHIRAAAWHGITGSLVWLPARVILLYAFGAGVWIDTPQKVYWLVSGALVCLGLNYGLIRLARSSGSCGSYFRRRWIGHTVNRAQMMLDEIERFEREVS